MGRKSLSFALTWQRNTEPVGAAATDLLRWLGKEIGCTLTPRVAIAYEDIFGRFERGEVDFAWLPPIAFLRLRARKLARTLFVNQRHGARAYHAVVATRADSHFTALDKLQGARVAWIDPYSTTGYVLPLLGLVERGVDPRKTFGEERFVGSHDAAARAVYDCRSDLLGTFAEYEGDKLVRAGFSGAGALDDWRVLLRAGESPSDVLAAHTSLDEEVCTAIKEALARAFDDPERRKLVQAVFHVDRFAEVDDDEARYTSLEELIRTAQSQGLLGHL